MLKLTIDLMLNNIKLYLRQDKKTYIYFFIKVLLITFAFIISGENFKKYSEYGFLFFLSVILFQGIYSMITLCVTKHELNNTKYILILPVNIQSFILSKNLLTFIVLFIELLIIELIFILSNLLPIVHINKFLSFIIALIFSISVSNILFKVNHKRDDINEKSPIKSIKEGYKLILILILFTSLILFIILNSYISFVFKFIISIIFYIFSFKLLKKDIIKQSIFIEEIDQL